MPVPTDTCIRTSRVYPDRRDKTLVVSDSEEGLFRTEKLLFRAGNRRRHILSVRVNAGGSNTVYRPERVST